MKMLVKNPNDGKWPGNWIADKNCVEKRKLNGSKQDYTLVHGYPGVYQHIQEPAMFDYCFDIGGRGAHRSFSSDAPYVMEAGDSLTDVLNYVKWQRGQAINAMHKQISEVLASENRLASFRRGTQIGISKSAPGILPNREGSAFVGELISQNTVKRFNDLGLLSSGIMQSEANKLLRCLPFCRLPASTDDIIQSVIGRYSSSDIQASYEARKKFLSVGDPDGSLRKIMVWICSY